MEWQQAAYKTVETTESDVLGNTYKTYGATKTIPVRATEWSVEDIELYGREVTQTQRKLITPHKEINADAVIELEGVRYKIERVKNYKHRFKVMYIQRYKAYEF